MQRTSRYFVIRSNHFIIPNIVIIEMVQAPTNISQVVDTDVDL
jgi:hypothetical protein